MKRSLSLLVCLLILFSLSPSAAASKLMPGLKEQPSGEHTVYEDDTTGNTLSIPAGWEIAQVTGDAVAKAEFSLDSAVIQYGSTDMWSTLSASMQKKISREEFDNEVYTTGEIAELVGTEEKYVESITLEDLAYFRAVVGKRRFFFFKTTDTYLIHVTQGWMYVYAFNGSDSHDQYPVFEEIVRSAAYEQPEEIPEETVPETTAAPVETVPPTTVPSDADIYADAVEAYEEGRYYTAKDLFQSVSPYKDSQKYLRLLRIRNYGENTGIGSVYSFSKALTDSEKEEVDKAAADFYFADTAQVLLCNTDVACYYLFGDWNTGAGASQYAYFRLKKDASGGYYYTRSTNLSKAVSDCVSIIDGEVRISITSSNTLVFHLELTAPDCMEIYSYETCKSFTLYR